MPFKKGDPNINRTGLNKGYGHGRKNIRWNNLQDLAEWAGEIAENLPAEIVLEYIKHKEILLLGKISSVPATPAESLENTKDPKTELEQAESSSVNPQS